MLNFSTLSYPVQWNLAQQKAISHSCKPGEVDSIPNRSIENWLKIFGVFALALSAAGIAAHGCISKGFSDKFIEKNNTSNLTESLNFYCSNSLNVPLIANIDTLSEKCFNRINSTINTEQIDFDINSTQTQCVNHAFTQINSPINHNASSLFHTYIEQHLNSKTCAQPEAFFELQKKLPTFYPISAKDLKKLFGNDKRENQEEVAELYNDMVMRFRQYLEENYESCQISIDELKKIGFSFKKELRNYATSVFLRKQTTF